MMGRDVGQSSRASWLLSWLSTGGSRERSGSEPSSPVQGPPDECQALNWASASQSSGIPRLLNSKGQVIETGVLSPCTLQQLAAAIPSRFMMADWRLLYSTAVHGISLNTLYLRTAGCGACLLVIKDRAGNVFGGFCSEWRPPSKPSKFYGSGETFLFAVETVNNLPRLLGGEEPPNEAVRVFRWTGNNSYFMFSDREYLAMGSGGHFGVWLDAELLHGSSGSSATFGNPCLCRQPDNDSAEPDAPSDEVGEFSCDVLEVWGMDHGAISRRSHQLRQEGVYL